MKDDQGVTLAESLRRFGLDPDQIEAARLEPSKVAAYVELHIEQGAVLEHQRKASFQSPSSVTEAMKRLAQTRAWSI